MEYHVFVPIFLWLKVYQQFVTNVSFLTCEKCEEKEDFSKWY